MVNCRSHRRRIGPQLHVLLAGCHQDALAMATVLAGLPADAYGQVIFYAAPGTEVPQLIAPARVHLTVLRGAGADSTAGARLAGAIDSWMAEWMPDDLHLDREFRVWIGAAASGVVDGLRQRVVMERL